MAGYLGLSVLAANFVIEPTGGALFAQAAKAPFLPALLFTLALLATVAAMAVVRRTRRADGRLRRRLDRVTTAAALGAVLLALLTVAGVRVLVSERLDPSARLHADLNRLPALPGAVQVAQRERPSRNGFDQPLVLRELEVRGRSAADLCSAESAALARLGGPVRPAGLRPVPGRPGPECILASAVGRDLVTVGVRAGHAASAVLDVTELNYPGGFAGTDVVTLVREATAQRP
ncbi:MAG: hypothetical protein M3Z02_10405 [Actinomycetota bacterium]|nr:hypothetical protein [Actinomycetota bacterium]